jgi:hypothetical protein
MLELWGSPPSNYRHHIRLCHQLLVILAPRGSPLLRRQQPPRLGQDHPREAPPVSDPAAVHVILEIVAAAGAKIRRTLLSQAIEPGMILRRQVIVGKVVQVVAPYRPAYGVELAVDQVVFPGLMEPVKGTGEFADACPLRGWSCEPPSEPGPDGTGFLPSVHAMFFWKRHKTTIAWKARLSRAGGVIRTAINNCTFDGSTKHAMQQTVRDARIAFTAATAQAQLKPRRLSASRHRAYLGRSRAMLAPSEKTC